MNFGGQSDREGRPRAAARSAREKLIECAVYTERLVSSVHRADGLRSSRIGLDELPRQTV